MSNPVPCRPVIVTGDELFFNVDSSKVREEATRLGLPPTKESVWSYFIQKSVSNMHIVLAMSPVGELLKTRCRNFPGLVNNVSIDWFTAWPKQALHAVASQFLAEVLYTKHRLNIHLVCPYYPERVDSRYASTSRG